MRDPTTYEIIFKGGKRDGIKIRRFSYRKMYPDKIKTKEGEVYVIDKEYITINTNVIVYKFVKHGGN